MPISEMRLITNNNDIPRIGSALQFEYCCFALRRIENGRVSGRRLQRLPGMRVEYAPISEMRLITRDYGITIMLLASFSCQPRIFLQSQAFITLS